MKLISPPAVFVYPDGGKKEYQAMLGTVNVVSPRTNLFRSDTCIDRTLGIAADRLATGRTLNIISACCSYGPEVDTVLALAHRSMPGLMVSILGLDVNERALDAARRAKYCLPNPLETQRERYAQDFDLTMSSHGIEVEPGSLQAGVLNTTRLRSYHEVMFSNIDVRKKPSLGRKADLVACHNALYYHTVEDADRMIANLAGLLAMGGVLSLGASHERVAMEANRGPSYQEWCDRAAENLAAQGIMPLQTGVPMLRVFQRIAA